LVGDTSNNKNLKSYRKQLIGCLYMWLSIENKNKKMQKLKPTKRETLTILTLANVLIYWLLLLPLLTNHFSYLIPSPHTTMIVEVAEEVVPVLSPIEDFYHQFENNIEFRNYITDLRVKRNNPGNLRFANQPGAINNGGFAEFKTPLLGFRALVLQMAVDQTRDLTIRTLLEKYSPPHENSTEHLISAMSDRLGLLESTNIKNINTVRLAQDITRQEHSVKY